MQSCTEEYDGSSWSAGGALITGRQNHAGAGTQNAGLAFGGAYNSPGCVNTEEYNGTSWVTGGAMGTGRGNLAGAGIQTAALGIGGNSGGLSNPSSAITEEYNAPIVACTL